MWRVVVGSIALGIALILFADTVARWIECNNSGGRFMREPFSMYECV